jgi:hypothetical protein
VDRVERQGAVHLRAVEVLGAEVLGAEVLGAEVLGAEAEPLEGGPAAEDEEPVEARGPGIEISKR